MKTNANTTESESWKHVINELLTKLATDLHNHRQLADPWKRKAQSMTKTWTQIIRFGCHPSARPAKRPPTTWIAAARAMTFSLHQRANLQRARTGWKRWASDRALEARRWPGKFRTISSRLPTTAALAGSNGLIQTAA